MEHVKIYFTNGKSETIVGAVATNGTSAGFEFMLYTGETVFFPHQHYRKLKRKRMTDEEILASNNKGLVDWYREEIRKFEKAEAEKEAAEAAEKAATELEPVAVDGQDVEE